MIKIKAKNEKALVSGNLFFEQKNLNTLKLTLKINLKFNFCFWKKWLRKKRLIRD